MLVERQDTYIGKPVGVGIGVGEGVLVDGVSELVHEDVVGETVGIVRSAHEVVVKARGSLSTQASQRVVFTSVTRTCVRASSSARTCVQFL